MLAKPPVPSVSGWSGPTTKRHLEVPSFAPFCGEVAPPVRISTTFTITIWVIPTPNASDSKGHLSWLSQTVELPMRPCFLAEQTGVGSTT